MEEQLTLLVMSGYGTDISPLTRVDPRVTVVDGRWRLLSEYRRSYPAYWVSRALPEPTVEEQREQGEQAYATQAQAERDRLLGEADMAVSFAMAIFPPDLPERAPRLRWLHAASAGSDRLREGQGRVLAGSYVITTGRGHVNPVPIAEYVMAAVFYFAKSLPQAHADKARLAFAPRSYHSQQVAGKTLGIVGLGGIGSQVARLAKAVGMEVIATRYSATERLKGSATGTEGVDELLPRSHLLELLGRSDYVVICALWTPESFHLIGQRELAAMKPTAYLINPGRGALLDEAALKLALQNERLAGAMLDVYEGEMERPADAELWSLPNVILTPHVSGRSDRPSTGAVDFYCQQLQRYLRGEPLENVVDLARGY